MLTVLDLFSGIGGMSLGLESTGGFRTVAFCEIEPFPRLVLQKHWPGVPIFEDVRTLTAESLGGLRPDLICGGFPCQDISVAGKGAGLHGHRSGLWFEYARLVGELRPRWVLAENVGALRTRGVDRVCSDLEAEGYAVWPLLVGAWATGAPHKRERVWILAHRHPALREQSGGWGRQSGTDPTITRGVGSASGVGLADPYQRGRAQHGRSGVQHGERAASRHDANGRGKRPVGDTGVPRWPARPGEPQHEWEEPRLSRFGGQLDDTLCGRCQRINGRHDPAEPSDNGSNDRVPTSTGSRHPEFPLGGAAHGVPVRLARRANREALKALGNSVVPQVVHAIGRAILDAEEGLDG